MAQWFAVHTQPHAEQKAKINLERQGFEVYLPRYLKRRSHARKIEWVPSPLFPRYLFTAFDPAVARWRSIMSTFGVSHLICRGNLPVAVPEDVVELIRGREDEKGMVTLALQAPFEKGETVQVTAGTLVDQVGLFDHMTDDDRVVILLKMLGREVSASLPLNAVRAVA
ncbi:MAG: transcriptional activator RfaH [Alphaproteobacteria bacterium]|nr:transcriptional activator RfaH [Alphaproteobacteria bacterium]